MDASQQNPPGQKPSVAEVMESLRQTQNTLADLLSHDLHGHANDEPSPA